MNRRTFLAHAGALPLGCLGSRWTANTYRNPVFEQVFPDPSVIRANGEFFAYATYHDWGTGPKRRLIPIVRSRNLVDWEYVGRAFETRPDWKDEGGLWAPDIGFLDGRYVLYYSFSTFGDDNPGIGVATAETPAGPFTDRGELIRSDDVGVPNSIDPCLFVDDGTPYLFWGSHRGIYGIRLSSDGLALDGEKFQIAGEGVEAPYLVERDGRYYFFGSRGRCCAGAESTYHVVVARANSLRGPYANRSGDTVLSATGTTILSGSERFAGPGHNAVVRDDAGTDWLLYHAYERDDAWIGDTPRRVLFLDALAWTDDWPTVEGGVPSAEARAPVVDA